MMRREPEVIFEDNHLLVVNKPALLPTMGASSGEESLLEIARAYIGAKYNKPGKVYLGVVSRLDSFVSGVIVFARTSKAAARLNRQFADSTPKKVYLAIVPSEHCPAVAELEHWLFKDESMHRMICVSQQHSGAKRARLSFRQIGHFENLSLLEIRLLSGRKHQIRVQLATAASPIVGDRKYGSDRKFPKGIALHSTSLTIVHPTLGTEMMFDCPPPDYWNRSRFC